MKTMTPSRPYLVRALNEWILDNQCTPYVLVDASLAGVQVPQDYVNKGQIVLNISMTAVQNLLIDDQGLSFNARFGGVPMSVYLLWPFWRYMPRKTVRAWCLDRKPVLLIPTTHPNRQNRSRQSQRQKPVLADLR